MGQRVAAVPVSQEAVDLLRELVELNRDAYLPDLATSLNNHALRRAEVGQREQALASEALAHYHLLAGTDPDIFGQAAKQTRNLVIYLREHGT